jgi:hypothetical protein
MCNLHMGDWPNTWLIDPSTSLSAEDPGNMSERAGKVCANVNTEVSIKSMNFRSLHSKYIMQQRVDDFGLLSAGAR